MDEVDMTNNRTAFENGLAIPAVQEKNKVDVMRGSDIDQTVPCRVGLIKIADGTWKELLVQTH